MTEATNNLDDISRHASFLTMLARDSMRGEDVEDLVQDCLLVGMEKAPRDPARTTGWFRTVLRRRVAENHRKYTRRLKREQRWAPPEAQPSAFDTVEHRAALKAVTNAVADLPPELYDMIRLRYFEGKRVKQIAKIRDLSVRTVKYRLELALGELRWKLDRREKGPAALVLLGGLGQKRILGLGSWFAMKKTAIVVVIALVAIGTISWVAWLNNEAETSKLENGTVTETNEASIEPRRESSELNIPQGSTSEEAKTAIDRERDIFGQVVDNQGTPIAGARIESRRFPWKRLSILSSRSREHVVADKTTSAADGGFALRHKRGDVVELEVSKPGYATLLLTRRVAGEKVDIVLGPACVLEIKVTTADGDALENAAVSAWREESENSRKSQFDQRRGRTGADGILRFADLAPGPINFYVRHLAHPPSSFKTVTIEATKVTHENIILMPAGVIRGRVTAKKDGEPIAGAEVSIQWGSLVVKTDSEGYYERPGVPTAENQWFGIEVQAEGYARSQRNAKYGAPTYDFALSRGDVVEGRCLDHEGNPIGGVRVSLIASSHNWSHQVIDTGSDISDSAGRFRIGDLRRSLPHTLILDARGFGRRHIDFDPPTGDGPQTTNLGDLTLDPGLRIAGRVVREDGTSVANATINLKGTNADRAKLRDDGAGPAQTAYGQSESRRTDDLGRFCFADLPSAGFELEILIHGAVPVMKTVTLEGANIDDLEIIVGVPRPLVVKVQEDTGAPVPDAYLSLYDGDDHILSRKTGAAGEASFAGAPRKTLVVKLGMGVDSPFRQVEPKEIDPTQSSVTIVLERATPTTGRVVGPGGKGIANLEVIVHLEDKQTRSIYTKRGGKFSIDLPVGQTVDIEVSGKQMKRVTEGMYTTEVGLYHGRLERIVTPSQGVTVRVEKRESNLSFTVVVFDSEGRKVAGARVYASPAGGFKPQVTDATGQVEFVNLTSGEQRVQAHPPKSDNKRHYTSAAKHIKPANQTVELHLREAQILEGKVVLPDGKPAVKFVVEAFHEGQEHYRWHTNADGEFTLTLVKGLSYTLKAYSRDRKLKGQLDEVTNGPVTLKVKPAGKD